MTELHQLDIPDGVLEEEVGHEFVRFWVAGGVDHVSLYLGQFRPETEATDWGTIAADIVKHAIRGMLQQDPTRDEVALFAEIERAFLQRLEEQTNIMGQIKGTRN